MAEDVDFRAKHYLVADAFGEKLGANPWTQPFPFCFLTGLA